MTTIPSFDESATKSASCRKIPQVCQFCSMFPICLTAKLKSLFTCNYYIIIITKKQRYFVKLFLERYEIRRFCLDEAEEKLATRQKGFRPNQRQSRCISSISKKLHIINTECCISSLRKLQPTADDIHATRDDIRLTAMI